MRIISGKYRGKRLLAPKNLPSRPTTDFAKEALFNLLQNEFDLNGVNTLDLFAGTGNISYELWSRGASSITLVEQNPNCYRFIKRILSELEASDSSTLVRADVFKFLERANGSFDIIFCDPPYDLEKAQSVPDIIFEKGLVAPEGVLIMEHGSRTSFDEHPHFSHKRTYSSVNFSFFYL